MGQKLRRVRWVVWGIVGCFALFTAFTWIDGPGVRQAWELQENTRDLASERSIVILSSTLALLLGALVLVQVLFYARRRPIGGAVEVGPERAMELAGNALGQLEHLGFRPVADGPLAGDRFSTEWRQRGRRSSDPRRFHQDIRLEFADGRFTIQTSIADRLVFYDQGDLHYQRWLVERLLSGASIEHPPCGLSIESFVLLCLGVGASSTAAFMYVLPESATSTWDRLFMTWLILIGGIVGPFLAATAYLGRRYTQGFDLGAAGIAFFALGGCLWFLRPDEWERYDWRTIDDPEVLCRIYESAERDEYPLQWNLHRPLSPREIAAGETREAVEREIVSLGARAVPAVERAYRTGRSSGGLLDRMGGPSVDAALRMLDDSNATLRRQTLRLIDRLPFEERVERAVLKSLSDPDPQVRGIALSMIGSSADPVWGVSDLSGMELLNLWSPRPSRWSPDIEAAVLKRLDDPVKDIRALALQKLWLGGPRCVPRLIEFASTDDELSVEAYEALLAIGDPRALPLLIEDFRAGRTFLYWHPDPSVGLLEAARNLNALAPTLGVSYGFHLALQFVDTVDYEDEDIERLIDGLRGPDAEVRRLAIALLSLSSEPHGTQLARQAFLNEGSGFDLMLARSLVRRGLLSDEELRAKLSVAPDKVLERFFDPFESPDGIPAELVLEVVRSPGRGRQVKEEAVRWIQERAPERFSEAANTLPLSSTEVPSLGDEFWDALTTENLFRLLESPAPEMRKEAARALVRDSATESVERLLSFLAGESHPEVRNEVIAELGRTRVTAAVGLLIGYVEAELEEKERSETFWTSIQALGEIGDVRARPALAAALAAGSRRKDVTLMYEAAIALGKTGGAGVIPLLRQAVWRPRGSGWGAPYAHDATRALGRIGDPAVPHLIEILNDPMARGDAAEALGMTGAPVAFELLVGLLDDLDPGVRRAAAIGLGHLGDSRAVIHLVRAVEDHHIGAIEAAAWALQSIAGQDFGAPRLRVQMELESTGGFSATRAREAVRRWAAARP